MKSVLLLTVALALTGCAGTQRLSTSEMSGRSAFPVALRVDTTTGVPKVYASKSQIQRAIGKDLPSEGWVSSQDVHVYCVRSSTPPDASGKMSGEAGIVPVKIAAGSSEILVFGNVQGCQPGYWGVRLMGQSGPISDWAIVELKK